LPTVARQVVCSPGKRVRFTSGIQHKDRSERRGRSGDVPAGPEAELTSRIIELAIKLHRRLGPGLREAGYEKCLCWELANAGLALARQADLPIRYADVIIASSDRADLIVEGRVILELKSLEYILPVHTAQTLTYLRLSSCEAGLLLNFGAPRLVDGIRRFVP
jgi:GxxExxY protein